jgi:hypothetical protein
MKQLFFDLGLQNPIVMYYHLSGLVREQKTIMITIKDLDVCS